MRTMGRVPVRSWMRSARRREVDAFQNVHACRHMHRDAVRLDADGRLIQEAVDRQSFAFELLNEGAGGLRGDIAVIEIVSEGQLIALEHRFQRRKKPPAHGAVQRLRAAQADDDLGGRCGYSSTRVDQYLPETGVELGIGRKLRPDLCDKGFQGVSFFWGFGASGLLLVPKTPCSPLASSRRKGRDLAICMCTANPQPGKS